MWDLSCPMQYVTLLPNTKNGLISLKWDLSVQQYIFLISRFWVIFWKFTVSEPRQIGQFREATALNNNSWRMTTFDTIWKWFSSLILVAGIKDWDKKDEIICVTHFSSLFSHMQFIYPKLVLIRFQLYSRVHVCMDTWMCITDFLISGN